jgi:hypothetical protein
MTDTVQRLATLEDAGIAHEGRLLILINAFSQGEQSEGIRGLTKLAKLDFLLRYPTYLQRALLARGRSTRAVNLKDFETRSVESRMVRYRFGPWDHRYPEMLRRLSARGLVTVTKDGRTVIMRSTAAGSALAGELSKTATFDDVTDRAGALHTHLDLTATGLMKFIYETFPEVLSLRSNEEIDL